MPVIGRLENEVGGTGVRTQRITAEADAVVSLNVLNETGAADRALMEHFFRARRRAKWPLVLVSERIMQANTAAATLVQSADHTLLWQWGSGAAATRDSTESALNLTTGLPVAVRAWPVEVSGLLAGVLIRLEPLKPDSAAGPRSGGGKRHTAYGWPSLTSTH